MKTRSNSNLRQMVSVAIVAALPWLAQHTMPNVLAEDCASDPTLTSALPDANPNGMNPSDAPPDAIALAPTAACGDLPPTPQADPKPPPTDPTALPSELPAGG